MERMSKRKFCAQYASKQDRANINAAGIIAYLCAAISLVMGLLQQNYGVILDVVLVVGLGLGVQLGKSRVCSILLLIYGCINTLVYLLSTGRLGGWWLILVGVYGIKATFHLHKEYQRFLADGSIPQPEEPQAPERSKPTWGKVVATLAPFFGLILSLLLLLGAISPALLNLLVGGKRTPELLLSGYCFWYMALIGAVITGVLLVAVGVLLSVWKGTRTFMAIILMVVSLAGAGLLGGAMLLSERVPERLLQAQADLAQIGIGQLETAEVQLWTRGDRSGLPGPYTEGQPTPVEEYTGYINDEARTKVSLLMIDGMFTPGSRDLYDNNQSIQWNQENTPCYQVSYTENFHLVISVEPTGKTPAGTAPSGGVETALPGDFTVPEGWVKDEAYSTDTMLLYVPEGQETAEYPDNISVDVGSCPYSAQEHEDFRSAILRQLAAQSSGVGAELTGSGSNTAQGYVVYTFTIQAAEMGLDIRQYYIVGDYQYCRVHATNNSGQDEVYEAAQEIVDSFVWDGDSAAESGASTDL